MSKINVSFEGVIGVGKTTLATLVAQEMGLEVILEEFDTEKLKEFYKGDMSNDKLFLFEEQLMNWRVDAIRNNDSEIKICDFDLAKSVLFGSETLDGVGMDKLKSSYCSIESEFRSDLTFVIVDELDSIERKIKKRARYGEEDIERDYLEMLSEKYDSFDSLKEELNEDTCIIYIPSGLVNLNDVSWFVRVIQRIQENKKNGVRYPSKVYGFSKHFK